MVEGLGRQREETFSSFLVFMARLPCARFRKLETISRPTARRSSSLLILVKRIEDQLKQRVGTYMVNKVSDIEKR